MSSCSVQISKSHLFLNSQFSEVQSALFPAPIRGEDNCFLYGVFNGYDGSRVASFASQCLTAELLLGQLNSSHTDGDVRRILTQVWSHTCIWWKTTVLSLLSRPALRPELAVAVIYTYTGGQCEPRAKSSVDWASTACYCSLLTQFVKHTVYVYVYWWLHCCYGNSATAAIDCVTWITILSVPSRCCFLLLQAFDVVEKSYFETIDDALAKKAHLSNFLLPHSDVCAHTRIYFFSHLWHLCQCCCCFFCVLLLFNFPPLLLFLLSFLYLLSSPAYNVLTYLPFTHDWAERVLSPAFSSEPEGAWTSEGVGAGGVRRCYSCGGTDPQQQTVHRQCWYEYTHTCTDYTFSQVTLVFIAEFLLPLKREHFDWCFYVYKVCTI